VHETALGREIVRVNRRQPITRHGLGDKLGKTLEKISPIGSRARRASVASNSTVLWTGAAITSTPSEGAAASTARKNSLLCGSSGLKTSATRVIEGAIC
jgi:hypothetical protein